VHILVVVQFDVAAASCRQKNGGMNPPLHQTEPLPIFFTLFRDLGAVGTVQADEMATSRQWSASTAESGVLQL
jgi:hypothetical protein